MRIGPGFGLDGGWGMMGSHWGGQIMEIIYYPVSIIYMGRCINKGCYLVILTVLIASRQSPASYMGRSSLSGIGPAPTLISRL